jgi:hypothetical protein
MQKPERMIHKKRAIAGCVQWLGDIADPAYGGISGQNILHLSMNHHESSSKLYVAWHQDLVQNAPNRSVYKVWTFNWRVQPGSESDFAFFGWQ